MHKKNTSTTTTDKNQEQLSYNDALTKIQAQYRGYKTREELLKQKV